jgi:rhodanese-related sulfurtransferase
LYNLVDVIGRFVEHFRIDNWDMKKLAIEIVVILAISISAGVVNNSVSANRIAWIGSWPSISDAEDDSAWDCLSCVETDPPQLSLGEASALYQNPEVLFLDARFPEEYAEGHIERAYLLPIEATSTDFDAYFNAVKPLLDSSRLIVTYCSGAECESSLFLARYLRDQIGLPNVSIFFGGWRRWENAGLPAAYPNRETETEN